MHLSSEEATAVDLGLKAMVVDAIDDMKGQNVVVLEVGAMTAETDFMVVATGTSNRHVRSIVDNVVEAAKKAGCVVRGVEGRETNEWVLVDLGDVVAHVMQAEARTFYELERLWEKLDDVETTV